MTIGDIIAVSFLGIMIVLIALGIRRNARSGQPAEGSADHSGADWRVDTHHSNDHGGDGGDGGD